MSLYIACLRNFGANAIGWHQACPFYYCSALPPVEPGVIFTPKDTNKSPPDTFLRATGGDMYYSRIIMPLTVKSF